MKVVITGANSAVGQAILRRGLESAGQDVLIAAVRSQRAADELRPLLGPHGTVARISYEDAASLIAAFRGAAAVVHLAGILIERPGATYEQSNVATVRGVVEAAKLSGVEKMVLVSATGANQNSSNGYYRTKGKAEALVRASGLTYAILRVPLLLGRGTEGAAALRRNASRSKAMLIGGGRNFQQPLYVDDLARAVMVAVQVGAVSNQTLDLVGPVSLPERQMVEQAAASLGHKIVIRSIPKGLVAFALAIRQRLAGPGFSRDALDVITDDTRLDHQPAAAALGIELTGIREMIETSLGQG